MRYFIAVIFVLLASSAWAQPTAQVGFLNVGSPLTCPCENGTVYEPDGANAIKLYADRGELGPDAADSLLASWDFGYIEPYWFVSPLLAIDLAACGYRLYIRINRDGCCWLSPDMALTQGNQEVFVSESGWECADMTCEEVDPVTEVFPGIPIACRLDANYPNPFNAVTTIEFEIPVTSSVELSIYNLMGERVGTLLDDRMSAGRHRVQWDGSRFASGVYFVRMQAGRFTGMRKIVLLR